LFGSLFEYRSSRAFTKTLTIKIKYYTFTKLIRQLKLLVDNVQVNTGGYELDYWFAPSKKKKIFFVLFCFVLVDQKSLIVETMTSCCVDLNNIVYNYNFDVDILKELATFINNALLNQTISPNDWTNHKEITLKIKAAIEQGFRCRSFVNFNTYSICSTDSSNFVALKLLNYKFLDQYDVRLDIFLYGFDQAQYRAAKSKPVQQVQPVAKTVSREVIPISTFHMSYVEEKVFKDIISLSAQYDSTDLDSLLRDLFKQCYRTVVIFKSSEEQGYAFNCEKSYVFKYAGDYYYCFLGGSRDNSGQKKIVYQKTVLIFG